MSNTDIIPTNDDGFDKLQKQMITTVVENPNKFGFTADEVSALQKMQERWSAAYSTHSKAQADALTATHGKDITRGEFETLVRGAARKINALPTVDNALRAEVGLPPHAETRSPIGAPTTRPIGRIEDKGHATLVVHFTDEATPLRLAKPYGVLGCQIWRYIGDTAPADETSYSFLALDTRTPYTDVHKAADAGKSAYYLLRWQSPTSAHGPWSTVVTAKIPH